MDASTDRRVFFFLHGDHPTLPRAELSALLDAQGMPSKERNPLPRVVRCCAPLPAADRVLQRAYMTRFGAEELIDASDDADSITRAVRDETALQQIDGSFRLSIYHAHTSKGKNSDGSLNNQIYDVLKERVKKSQNRSPDTRFVGVVSGGHFLFGRLLDSHPQMGLTSRSPHARPFFHPSALSPKLAGCMVNLTRIRENQLLLDPFCGVGSILIEASLLNCQVIGSDIAAQMVWASRKNLHHFGLSEKALAVADARALPFERVHAVATDPPYGKLSAAKGALSTDLIRDFLESVSDKLYSGSYLCFASNMAHDLFSLESNGRMQVVESHKIPVNDSLVRYVTVARRT